MFPLRPDSNDIAEWVNLEVRATVEVISEAKKVTISLYLNSIVYAVKFQGPYSNVPILSELVLPNEPDQSDPPLTRPCDPGGQPDLPLFAILRDQPDSTRFLTLGAGFNPIQPD